MTSFLTLQNTYHDIQLALFREQRIVATASASKIDASRMLIPLTSSMLAENDIQISELKFIAANIGPGPFTTLRTVLASANGLSFATQAPLIGIDALDAMLQEHLSATNTALVVLLNAFNRDVYFATRSGSGKIQKGCMNIDAFLAELAQSNSTSSLQFVGNGTTLHKDLILKTFGSHAIISNPIPEAPSIETIGLIALAQWERQENLVSQLMPVYLK